MTIEEAKQIKLQDYLHSLGFSPVKQQGDNLWYKSPFRDESEASFKVNTKLNQWYDFGIGQGGNIIALASCLYSASGVSYLLHRIEEQTPHIRPVSFSFRQQSFSEPSFQSMEIRPLSSSALLDYLSGRGINIPLAKRECVEVHFTNNGRRYFAIGFPNAAGGYEIRNRYFKGCVAPKDITHIRHKGDSLDTCYLFEGFMDYLSFLTLRQESYPEVPHFDKQDYMILNSVGNVGKALYPLGAYEHIHCFLDQDRAGMEAYRKLYREFGVKVRDSSVFYSGHKDLNEYLCHSQGKKIHRQSAIRKVPSKKNGRSI